MRYVFFVFAGGGAGSVCRYGVSVLSGKLFGNRFEWGTLAVNLLGSFLIGFLAGVFGTRIQARAWRVLLVSGFLGGFTTFSSFSYESIRLMQESPLRGALNVGLNLAGGLALAALGMRLAGGI